MPHGAGLSPHRPAVAQALHTPTHTALCAKLKPAILGPSCAANSWVTCFSLASNAADFEDVGATVNGDFFQESNGPTDGYAAIARADRLTQEPESIRKWREEQKKRLQELDAASKVMEQEWREKAKKDLEEWNVRQSEQMEKNRVNNRIADKAFYQQPDADVIGYVASEEVFLKESKEENPGTEWEKVAQLCDFNPKSSKQWKDVSRMRSVLISLKQTPLSR
ncbi:clathrin light chain B [Trachemys scripta elegans]|uniref:clathrin light chain B n=1 Tax=Trachemys scripta elegans TaxID=31138 RepID=UPI00155296F4|nr:clathrin light chain B [Trachemys scripta elegans]